MSNELQKLAGSLGCDIIGAETFAVPSGKAIYALWCRIDGATITSYKEIQGLGTENQTVVPISSGTKISEAMALGELWTFDKPLTEVVCSVEGLTAYYITI